MININYKKLDNIFLNYLQGELSIKTIDEFNAIIQIQFSHKPEVIALNCKDLHYLDSTGINHLFKLSKKAREKNIEILYLDLHREMDKMFKLTYLDRVCNVSSYENFESDYMY